VAPHPLLADVDVAHPGCVHISLGPWCAMPCLTLRRPCGYAVLFYNTLADQNHP
jgi:hypothetical protein